jgi:DNA-binding MarR family transcriptional regulator
MVGNEVAEGVPSASPPTLGVGASLRRAWLGYHRVVDERMAQEGFADRVFPDGRVLRMCAEGTTSVAGIGRALGITRQGAAKLVNGLAERGYVDVQPSLTSRREKVVLVTARGASYLTALRRARTSVDDELLAELGPETFAGLARLVERLARDDEPLSVFLRPRRHAGAMRRPEE